VADRRAWTVIVPTAERACDVILVTRGDAQADDIDQQVFALARGCRRQSAHLQRNDLLRKRFGDRRFWQFGCH
jgi:hypothetical protein